MCILVETLSEDEDDVMQRTSDSVSVSATYGSASEFTPTPGGPFSALTPSMWPQDIMVKLGNPVRKTCYPHGIPSSKKKKREYIVYYSILPRLHFFTVKGKNKQINKKNCWTIPHFLNTWGICSGQQDFLAERCIYTWDQNAMQL